MTPYQAAKVIEAMLDTLLQENKTSMETWRKGTMALDVIFKHLTGK